MNVLCVLGTRPEAIKLGPVIRALRRKAGRESPRDRDVVRVCVTGQHRELLEPMLSLFGIEPDYDLKTMQEDQSPTGLAVAVLAGLEQIIDKERPDWVLVQGDTTSTAVAAIAAHYAGLKVAHVEAGLRTGDKWRPFPEEINRRIAGVIADLHLAPTESARRNLRQEGVPDDRIRLTGNPVIDALHWVGSLPPTLLVTALLRQCGIEGPPERAKRLMLVTAHRRENLGASLKEICLALRDVITETDDDVRIVFPVHLNPHVWGPVHDILGDMPRIILIPPLDYVSLVHLLKRCHLVVTDSGGLQEEAPSLGVPVLVLRDVTERQEGVDAGVARLVGTSRARIASETLRLLRDRRAYEAMARAVNPYGDGRAAERIASALREAAAAGGGPAVHLSGSSSIPAANPAVSAWGEGQQRTDDEAPGRRGVQRYRRLYGAKRAVDILVSLALIVIGLPVFALGALLIRFESPGHVIYWRLRCGRNGRAFRCYKFRSMYEDAEVRFASILTANAQLREEYGRYHKLHRDPRITRVGRILRRFSLDELAQLWNVFVGDMSLVGPRPYDVTELAAMRRGDRVILTVRPGLTGLWQISGRNTMSFAHRLDLDRKYVREWSPWLELKIVVRTLPAVLSGRGAF